MSATEVLKRLEQAITSHDLDGMVDCYTEDYRSDLPLHPQRSFVGRENVRRTWTGLFEHVPDLVAEVLRSVENGDELWSEWEIRGTTRDGQRFLTRGVVILWVDGTRITSTRFYLDNVDPENPDTTS
ncbi:nuclear transport factor 2 family protein [Streptomyces sp. NPDC006645]|uniref:nuclear transport factor 2 family protein n=1 Tax=unclassified Streptomyces TaxID=2593676 RepID=UPI0033B444F3